MPDSTVHTRPAVNQQATAHSQATTQPQGAVQAQGAAHPSKPLVVGVVSDTHGWLDQALIAQLKGSDLIVHAGDICSRADLEALRAIAPVQACLGNNDYSHEYPGGLPKIASFYAGDLHWLVCHYAERIDTRLCNIAISGHTHRPFAQTDAHGCLCMNPGSPTFPRSTMGPTCGKIVVDKGQILSAEIIQLPNPSIRHTFF